MRKGGVKIKKKNLLFLYSLFHFLVDFSTIYLMYTRILPPVFGREEAIWWVLLYNALAFAVPLPVGILVDKWNRNPLAAAAGLGMILAGYLWPGSSLISLLLAGLGNGLFHVGGGLDVLNMSDDQYTPSGCFISTGAMGVFLGTFFGKKVFPVEAVILPVLTGGILLFLICGRIHKKEKLLQNPPVGLPFGKKGFGMVFTAFFLVVVLRSYTGSILSYDWKQESFWSVVCALSVMFGKMAGGILADLWGTDKVILSLGVSGILSLFSFAHPWAGIASIFLFNMTMPVTLLSMARIFPKAKGFAFGILTFALFLGVLPVCMQWDSPLFSPGGLLGLSWISMILLYMGWKKEKVCV